MKKWRRLGMWLLIIALLPVGAMFLLSCTGSRPSNLGVKDGKLLSCPSSPNCVSSQSEDEQHKIAPLAYTTTREEAVAQMRKVIEAMPRTKIVEQKSDYLYAEFTTLIFRFVDDVEFYFDDENKRIEVRSASRVGHSDFGVNRKRIEAVREKFNTLAKK